MKGEIVYQVLLSFSTNIITSDEKRDLMAWEKVMKRKTKDLPVVYMYCQHPFFFYPGFNLRTFL